MAVFTLYVFFVSFTITNWIILPHIGYLPDEPFIYNYTEVVLWFVMTIGSVLLFFSMIYYVHKMGKVEGRAEERRKKKDKKK